MNRKYFIIACLTLVFGAFSMLVGQDIQEGPAGGDQQEDAGDTADLKPAPEGGYRQNNYDPLALIDPRFTVSHFNLDRRFSGNGRGEFLDVVFDLNNSTSKPVRLYVWVVAFYETDAVNERKRNWVPYPGWRDRDYPAEENLVHHITITPQDIPDEIVWNVDDPDWHKQTTIIERMRNGLAGDVPYPDVHPPFWKYLQFIIMNPTKGLEFTLYGDTSPTPDKIVQSNFPQPTPEEIKIGLHKNLFKHKYTLQHTRRKTIFRSHHYSGFRADYKFFNRVAILVFDADRADAFEAQASEGIGEGDQPIEALVYKKVFAFEKPLKNN